MSKKKKNNSSGQNAVQPVVQQPVVSSAQSVVQHVNPPMYMTYTLDLKVEYDKLCVENKLLKDSLADKDKIILERDNYAKTNEELKKEINVLRLENAELRKQLDELKAKYDGMDKKCTELETYVNEQKALAFERKLKLATVDIIKTYNIYKHEECKKLKKNRNDNAHYINTGNELEEDEILYMTVKYYEYLKTAPDGIKQNINKNIDDKGEKLIKYLENKVNQPCNLSDDDKEEIDKWWK
jgi:hypothetical protein